MAISTTGFIQWEDDVYVGDCQTTTDILGPFYRPNAPVRQNLIIEGMVGEKISLQGQVLNDDCVTPLVGAKIELWHCSADEVYDNDSEDFNYRGITFAEQEGRYGFMTQMPVPYDAGGGVYRPAHFHLMISALGYQNLVTQLYFSGDDFLKKDPSSKSARAQKRVLDIGRNRDGMLEVRFDIIMQKELEIDPLVINRLVGRYQDEESDQITELFTHENQLWIKNELFGRNLQYVDNNTFILPGSEPWNKLRMEFKVLKNGTIQFTSSSESKGRKKIRTAIKI